ncbi:MAG: molybdopterin synthase sulfur carrier subunit [Chloroflexi bacterium]|nr:MAG: molybdopterin synthase sulfur carrier subunit [Chloroflexota bacterium]PIE80855.1 MAG: molybdopterin synthase sulfur carrier subunit [Chloroflexota bacterium]
MKINFYATLRPFVGQKTVELPLAEGCTVQDVLDVIVETFPPLRKELLDENGQLLSHVHLFINGRDAPYLEEMMATIIKANDKIDVFPAVGGG